MTIPDANSLLMSGGGRFASFKTPGDSVTGTIVDVGTPYHAREWNNETKRADGPPKYTKAGKPVYAFHLTLQTDERRPEDPEDDGTRVIDVNSWRMQDALRNAVRQAGGSGLEIGGRVTLIYVGDETPGDSRSGKKYTAQFERAGNVTLMSEPEPVFAAAQPPAAPTPQAPAGSAESPAAKAQKLIEVGFSDEEINQATGLELPKIAALRGNVASTPF